MTPNTDCSDADDPNASDYDADNAPYAAKYDAPYSKSIHLSLRNLDRNHKIVPNTPKKITLPPTLITPTLITPMLLTMVIRILTPCKIPKTRKIT